MFQNSSICNTRQTVEVKQNFSLNMFLVYRYGTIFWNLSQITGLPSTGMHANPTDENMNFLEAYVHNMGLCMNPKTMFYKVINNHICQSKNKLKVLIAIGFSHVIGDTPPSESWYHEKWLTFDVLKNNKNLEMATGYEKDIPCN